MAVKMKSLDMDRLRSKLEQMRNPGSGGTKRPLWKPNKDGEISHIRLIQYPWTDVNSDSAFVELWFHYGVGEGRNKNFLCPNRNFGKECPVCQFASELWKSDNDADKETAKELFPTQRVYAVVLDRADATNSPKLWGFGRRVYQTLLGHFEDPEECGFLDLYAGFDHKVNYEKNPKQKYPDTVLKLGRKECPLAEDDDAIQQIVDKIPKVSEVFQPITQSEVQEQLSSFVGITEDNVEEVSSEVTKGSKESSEDDVFGDDIGGSSVEDIEAAFDEALG